MPIIVGAFAFAALARVVIEVYTDLQPGLIIDGRTNPITIAENKTVAGDKAVVIGPDGTLEVVDIRDDEDISKLVDALVGKMLPGA